MIIKSYPGLKKTTTPIQTMICAGVDPVFLRQYFPVMAIFTLAVYRGLICGRKRIE
jgi:hypothetical protein